MKNSHEDIDNLTVSIRPASPSPHGLHIISDLYECQENIELMYHSINLEKKILTMVSEASLNGIQSSFYQFPNSGVTGVVLLAESHVSLHTWPEIQYISLDIFVCNMHQDNKSKAHTLYNNCLKLFAPNNIKDSFVNR